MKKNHTKVTANAALIFQKVFALRGEFHLNSWLLDSLYPTQLVAEGIMIINLVVGFSFVSATLNPLDKIS